MKEYFAIIDGKKKGPYTADELFLIEEVDSATLIWTKGMTEWKSLKEVPEFEDSRSLIPPPVPKSVNDDFVKVRIEKEPKKKDPVKAARFQKALDKTLNISIRSLVILITVGSLIMISYKALTYWSVKSDYEKSLRFSELSRSSSTGGKNSEIEWRKKALVEYTFWKHFTSEDKPENFGKFVKVIISGEVLLWIAMTLLTFSSAYQALK